MRLLFHSLKREKTARRRSLRAENVAEALESRVLLSNTSLDVPQFKFKDGIRFNNRPTLTWTPIDGAARYDLSINYRDTGFVQFIRRWDITTASFTPGLELPEGSYEARVQAIDAADQPSGWSAKINFRVDVPTPNPPSAPLAQPAVIRSTMPTIGWDEPDNSARYVVQVRDLDLNETIYSGVTTDPNWQPETPLGDGNYRVWVQAENLANDRSEWGVPISFEVEIPKPGQPEITGIRAYTDRRINLEWTDVEYADTFSVLLQGTQGTSTDVLEVRDVRDTSITLNTLIESGNYVARVLAINESGSRGEYSDAHQFSVTIPPVRTPVVSAPIVSTVESPTIRWSRDPSANSYAVQVTNASTGEVVIDVADVTTTYYESPITMTDGSYIATVQSFAPGAIAEDGLPSAPHRFEVQTDRPRRPTILAPAEFEFTAKPTLQWALDNRATSYELVINNLSNGQEQVIHEESLSVTSFVPTNALRDGKYELLVRATGLDGRSGPWSHPREFVVRTEPNDPDNLNHMQELWSRAITPYLQDPLWIERDRYDAGVRLMPLIHAAFQLEQDTWLTELADHYSRAAEFDHSQVDRELYRLQYFYPALEFMRLATESDRAELVPAKLLTTINAEVESLWLRADAGNWFTTFRGMRSRLLWKLDAKYVDYSYYRAVNDSTLMVMAMAADLKAIETARGEETRWTRTLDDILSLADRMYEQEGQFNPDGSWIFQQGVWRDYYTHQFAGYSSVEPGARPQPVADIGEDAGHAMRYPIFLRSMANAYPIGSETRERYEQRLDGFRELIDRTILVHASDETPYYRLNNYIDGTNGVYRWNYPTLANNTGILPFQQSRVLLHGWYGLAGGTTVQNVYHTLRSQFPLSDVARNVYYNGGTSIREINPALSNFLENGMAELGVLAASSLRFYTNVAIEGTSGDDEISVTVTDRIVVEVNGQRSTFHTDNTILSINGLAGVDSVIVQAGPKNDTASIIDDQVSVAGDGYEILATGVEDVTIGGGGGFTNEIKIAAMSGSAKFVGRPNKGVLTGNGVEYSIAGFEDIEVVVTAGQGSTAEVYDSPGNDSLNAYPSRSQLQGDGYTIIVEGFDTVDVYATSGDSGGTGDRADLYDSIGSDQFVGGYRVSSLSGNGYANRVHGFDQVIMHGGAGGDSDVAMLTDHIGDDQFHSHPTFSYLEGELYLIYVERFGAVTAQASSGNIDDRNIAFFFDSQFDDRIHIGAGSAVLTGPGFRNEANGFDKVHVDVNAGGFDTLAVEEIDFEFSSFGEWEDEINGSGEGPTP